MDEVLRTHRVAKGGCQHVLFARADFITLHTPLTNKTRNIIDAAAIAKTKDGVRIVNCARGGLIVEEDLAAALYPVDAIAAKVRDDPLAEVRESFPRVLTML